MRAEPNARTLIRFERVCLHLKGVEEVHVRDVRAFFSVLGAMASSTPPVDVLYLASKERTKA